MHNVSKHAGNAPVQITLARTDQQLLLQVCDEGVGFDLAQARLNDGLGLVSMQERVRLLGGTLSISSQPGDGTKVEALVPLPTGDVK